MKRAGSFIILFFFSVQNFLLAQTVSVPDPAFLNFLKTEYPSVINASDQLIISQAATVNGTLDCSNNGIQNLEGVQYFTGIKTLSASYNNISSLPDISSLTLLEKLFISNNKLTKLPSLTNNLNLLQIIAFSNLIDTLPPLNHLTSLFKIDLGDNKLKKLPDMSALVNMEQLLIWKNQLDSVPDLSNYPNLWRFNAGTNLLKYTPDFSQNPRMKILYLNTNLLTTLPDLSILDSLEDVRFQENSFDFADLNPILSYPGKDTIFDYTPQSDFPGDTLYVSPGDSLQITSGIYSNSPATYQWYFNGVLTYTTPSPILKTYPAVAGEYYVEASSSAFPGLTLKTKIFKVNTNNCLDLSALTFDIDPIKCLKPGELWINSVSLPTGNYMYQLEGTITHKIYSSPSGKFKDLSEPSYSLTIHNDQCTMLYPTPITIPLAECDETYITPDGDGDMDSYVFDRQGKVVIYDKQGQKVTQLALPGEWDGTDSNGKRVPQGYYISNVNEGQELINITVIY